MAEVTDETSEVLEAASAAALDVNELVKRVDAVLAEPLYWFPVRHHSPTIARHIRNCIRQRKPKIIFIEGPHEAQEMIDFITDAKTKPPVAIYSSFRFDTPTSETPSTPLRASTWYPMVSYSPEYVAMMAAKEV